MEGPQSELKKIRAYYKKDKKESKFFESFYPCPDPEHWYERCCSNWWTKWDVDPQFDTLWKTDLSCSFDSAWDKPDWAITKLAELHPKVRFKLSYDEQGCGFSGIMERQDWEYYWGQTFDDAYYWEGKECEECHGIYDGDEPEQWYDDTMTLCEYCGHEREHQKNDLFF